MHKIWLLLLPVLMAVFCACSRQVPPEKDPAVSVSPTDPPILSAESTPLFAEGQLYCSAPTREDAEAIAELYGITLVEYDQELALFTTEEDPDSVIARGKAQGWPLLVRNRNIQYF